ncbi:MAG: two-CW domain-containing protein [Bdellovibrionota bacterium]
MVKMYLKNCWEIKNCGREEGGINADKLGICPAAKNKLGRQCWWISGTLCGGKVQGMFAEKEKNCMTCEVYKLYNPVNGIYKDTVLAEYKDEMKRGMAIRKK